MAGTGALANIGLFECTTARTSEIMVANGQNSSIGYVRCGSMRSVARKNRRARASSSPFQISLFVSLAHRPNCAIRPRCFSLIRQDKRKMCRPLSSSKLAGSTQVNHSGDARTSEHGDRRQSGTPSDPGSRLLWPLRQRRRVKLNQRRGAFKLEAEDRRAPTLLPAIALYRREEPHSRIFAQQRRQRRRERSWNC